MIAELNIGLDIGQRKDALTNRQAFDAVRRSGLTVRRVVLLIRPKKETTVWFTVEARSTGALRSAVHSAAVALQQDCIAVRYRDGSGDLIGPAAAKWGSFDPAYFQSP